MPTGVGAGKVKVFIYRVRGYPGLHLIILKFGHRNEYGKVRYDTSLTIYMVFLAGKSPNIRSCTMHIYGSGNLTYNCCFQEHGTLTPHIHSGTHPHKHVILTRVITPIVVLSGSAVDIALMASCLSLDVCGTAKFGYEFGSMESGGVSLPACLLFALTDKAKARKITAVVERSRSKPSKRASYQIYAHSQNY